MKRGLIPHDPSDAVRAEAARRVDALRARVVDAGCALALVYGDVSRADDIAYLGTLCVYWNEGILAVPAEGDAAFITKLSPRVHPWMRASSTLTDLRSGPDLPKLVGGLLADRQAPTRPRIGLVELDLWPSGLLADLARMDAELVDLGDAVRVARLVPGAPELEQLHAVSAAAARAADTALAVDGSAAERIGEIERITRRAGVTDVFAQAGGAADGSATAGAVAQQQHLWVRAVRAAGGPLADEAAAGAARAAAALRAGAAEAQVAAAAHAGTASPAVLTTTCVRHVDLIPDGGARRAAGDDGPLRRGEVVVVAVTAASGDDRATVADTFLLTDDGAVALTRPEELSA